MAEPGTAETIHNSGFPFLLLIFQYQSLTLIVYLFDRLLHGKSFDEQDKFDTSISLSVL